MRDTCNDFEDLAPEEGLDAGESPGAQSALDIPLELSFGRDNRDVKPVLLKVSLRDLAARWATPDTERGSLSRDEYLALDKKDKAQKKIRAAEKNGEYFSPARFKGNSRAAGAKVESLSACVLDMDGGKITASEIEEKLADVAHLTYTSYSHHPEAECLRVIIPFTQPVDAGLHARAWNHFNDMFEGKLDQSSEIAARIYYTPACPYDAVGDYQCILVDGTAFDPATLPEPSEESCEEPASDAPTSSAGRRVDVEKLKAALAYLDADDRDQWVHVGMALKHDLGDGGFFIWASWSRTSAKYDQDDAFRTWESLDPRASSKPITVGTIFYRAQQAGWTRAKAPPEIEDLNQKYFMAPHGATVPVFVEDAPPGQRCRIATPMRVADFKNYLANRRVVVPASNNKTKTISLAEHWLQHSARRTYKGVVYSPEKDEPDYYNLWRGFAVDPAPGGWKRFRWHLYSVICRKKHSLYRYLLNWMAFAVQNPGKQPEVAVVIQGGRGAGKGVVARTMAELFGVHAQHISNSQHLTGKFNGHLRHCSFLFVDEAFWAGDKTGESVLKQLITEPTFMIEPKHFEAFKTPNYLHIMMASNNDWVVPAGDDERRFFVLHVDDSRQRDEAYFAALYAEINAGGREAMLYDLLRRDLSRFNIRKVPQTTALGEQKIRSLDPGEQWWFGKLVSEELIDRRFIAGGHVVGVPSQGTGTWGPVEKALLQDDYAKAMQRQHAGRQSSATALGKLLQKVLPAGYPRSSRTPLISGGHPVAVYDVGPLQACRDHWERRMELQGRVDWSDGSVRG